MLEGRVLRTSDQREFVKAEWTGTNNSGIVPLDDKCLIRMDEHAETTSGGIIITDTHRSQQTMASETGVVIALGEAAFQFNDDATRRWSTTKPKPGDRVVCERYSGRLVQGEDGIEYRLISQRAIGALYSRQE
jgi:co-chaperonin GroES (HSP10)